MEFNFTTCAAPADNAFGKTVSKYAEPVKAFYESGDEHQCMACADADEAKRLYGIEFQTMDDVKNVDAVIIAVAHDKFLSLSKDDINSFFNPKHKQKVLMDIKGLLDRKEYMTEDYLYWRL